MRLQPQPAALESELYAIEIISWRKEAALSLSAKRTVIGRASFGALSV